MKPDYKNWIPKGMVYGALAGTMVSLILLVVFALTLHGTARYIISIILALVTLGMCLCLTWCVIAYNTFSYTGKHKLARDIIDGVANYIDLADGETALDIGCGSGALTIAVAKKNPNARVIGCDRWGKEYASFSMDLCRQNAKTEGVENAEFQKGDATALPFEDGQFDAVISNYVYHNIPTNNRQAILLETLRTLKKGGTFAIHDIFSRNKYGDINAFIDVLYTMGYERVELIDTTESFMTGREAKLLLLNNSKLLTGKK